MRNCVFLDRDGVLIRSFIRGGVAHPPQFLHEVEVLPGVAEAIGLLKAEGFLLLVVTNQPDVARGAQTREFVEAINATLADSLPLDGFYVCYHDTADRCGCRKPAPGLLLAAAIECDIDLKRSYMVGDRGSDIAAGAAAGCQTFLIECPYSRCDPLIPTGKGADLLEVARQIQQQQRRELGGREDASHLAAGSVRTL